MGWKTQIEIYAGKNDLSAELDHIWRPFLMTFLRMKLGEDSKVVKIIKCIYSKNSMLDER